VVANSIQHPEDYRLHRALWLLEWLSNKPDPHLCRASFPHGGLWEEIWTMYSLVSIGALVAVPIAGAILRAQNGNYQGCHLVCWIGVCACFCIVCACSGDAYRVEVGNGYLTLYIMQLDK